MGGCRCSFRNCTSTSKPRTCHFFHFPVKDKERCSEWVKRADSTLAELPVLKLKNKVICDKHFSNNSFMNYKKDRLTHNAIPLVSVKEEIHYDSNKTKDHVNIKRETNSPTSDSDFTLSRTKTKCDFALNRPKINFDFTLPESISDDTKLMVTDVGVSGLIYSDNNLIFNGGNKQVKCFQPNKKIHHSKNIISNKTFKSEPRDVENTINLKNNETITTKNECINQYITKKRKTSKDSPIKINSVEEKLPEMLQSISQKSTKDFSLSDVKNHDKVPIILETISLNKSELFNKSGLVKTENSELNTDLKNKTGLQNKKNPMHPLTKQQLFQGIKKYLSPSMEVLLRMELFGSLDRNWQHDEKQLSIEFMNFGDDVYSYMTEELRWRLPSHSLVKQWQIAEYSDEELDL